MTNRLPKRVDFSLGEDRRFHLTAPRDVEFDELAKMIEPLTAEMDALIQQGWDMLLMPTVTTLEDCVEYEAILTKAKVSQ